MKLEDPILSDIMLQAKFYHETILLLIKKTLLNSKTQQGDEDGYTTFVLTNIVFDSSVFIYESIKYFEKNNEKFYNELTKFLSEEDLIRIKYVRNNMHLYKKGGSYKKKADKIINDRLEEFKMTEKDNLYFLRSDITRIYYINKNKKVFIGCDYFYFHYTLKFGKEDIKKFAENVMKILIQINGLKKHSCCLPRIQSKQTDFNIVLFDSKSKELLEINNLDKYTNFRLLLCLSQASWTFLLYFRLIDSEKLFDDSKWKWILVKNLAIKYDEIFDSVENLVRNSASKISLQDLFRNSGVDFCDSRDRNLIQELRNIVHYSQDDVFGNEDYYSSFKKKYNISTNDINKIFSYMKKNIEALIQTLQYF